MRPIHIARLDKSRPVVVLTREIVRSALTTVTIAPITTRVRGLSTEVSVGVRNGLDQAGVINCDNIATISVDDLGRSIGILFPDQERLLTEAIVAAFDLE